MYLIGKKRLQKLANALTLSRAISGLPVVIALHFGKFTFAWCLLLIMGLSDLADGWLARQAGGGTPWGARFDPLSDKLLLSAPMIWLASINMLPIWSVWLMIAREFLVSSWRSEVQSGGPASLGGKVKTSLQFASMLLLLWPSNWGGDSFTNNAQGLGLYLFWTSLGLAIISAFTYLKPRTNSYPK